MSNLYRNRFLGSSGIMVNPMALGCYSMSNAYGNRSDQESINVIKKAIDEGVNLIDTADFYGWGHNESLIAKAIDGNRQKIILSSKFGYVKDAEGNLTVCGNPKYLKTACEKSLKRLKTEYLDIYFLHRVDKSIPIEETVGAMAELVKEGKVRYIGLCEVSEKTLQKSNEIHPITAVQAEYSLWTRDVEDGMIGLCNELSVTLMAFSPLARGILSGTLRSLNDMSPDDVRLKYPRFYKENFEKNLVLIDEFVAIAKEMGCTPAQLALAWIYANTKNTIAIAGCDTSAIFEENIKSLKISLDNKYLEVISNIFQPGRIHGDRYHEKAMAMLDK